MTSLRWPKTVTAKSFSSRQNHFNHSKIILTTAKSFWPWQNNFCHGKIILTTARSFSTTHVTSVGKVLWELINYGRQLTRSFETRRRCFAQTVVQECL